MAAQQPDFPAAADALKTVAYHLELCQNLPVIVGGDGLVQALNAITGRLDTIMERLDRVEQRMDGLGQTMRSGFADLHERIDKLDLKVTVSNQNLAARMENNMRGHQGLMPLRSVRTGALINGFPSTLEELEGLSIREVDELLDHLGETGRGRADAKKRLLKLAMGITRQAV